MRPGSLMGGGRQQHLNPQECGWAGTWVIMCVRVRVGGRAEACQAVDEEREGLWLPARLGFKCFSFLFESNLKFKFE